MSKVKGNKKIFIILLIVLSFVSIFMLVKENYIANTTRRIFQDKTQKEAANKCEETFSNGGKEYVKITYEESELLDDDTTISYLYCKYSKEDAKKVGTNSITFDLTLHNVEMSATKFTCRAGKGKDDKVRMVIKNLSDWNVHYQLSSNLTIDKNNICVAAKTYGNLVDRTVTNPIGTGNMENEAKADEKNPELNREANAHLNPDGNIVEQNVSSDLNPDLSKDLADSNAAYSETVTEEYDDGDKPEKFNDDGEADDDDAEDEEGYEEDTPADETTTETKKTRNVQVNKKPFKNSSEKDIEKIYTFNSFQKQMGWPSSIKYNDYFVPASVLKNKAKRNKIDGSHSVYPDNPGETVDYGHRKNHYYGSASINRSEFGNVNNSKNYTLKCNYDLSKDEMDKILAKNRQQARLKNGKITDYYYDQSNTEFFYGVQIKEVTIHNGLKYTYHIENDLKDVKTDPEDIVCTKACQEIVKVEYGPPVYINAGLCFEYRVKATSIVRCKSKINKEKMKPPKDLGKPCIPSPTCHIGNTSTARTKSHQGGPNEDFETCVKSCDGGKYTRACSEKCYKEVYKDPTTALEQLTNSSAYTGATKLGSKCSYPGRYHRTSGGGVTYCRSPKQSGACQGGDGPVDDAGYWYQYYHYHVYHYSTNYAATASGFIKACESGGLCPDSCSWSGCGGNRYLAFNFNSAYKCGKGGICCSRESGHNFGIIKYTDLNGKEKEAVICNAADLRAVDNINNKVAYKEAKAQCRAETKCTTSTATFKIGFKYSTGSKSTIVETPYTTEGVDKLPSTESGGKHNRHEDNDITSLLSYGGCYHSSKKKRWYQTEWTFPATFIDNKTGERVYKNPNDAKHFSTAKGLVCLPRIIDDTNTAWGLKFYQASTGTGEYSTVEKEKTDSTLRKLHKQWICTFKEMNTATEGKDNHYDKKTNHADGYNIKATSTDFGYFKWDFNIYCFYSLINDVNKYNYDQSEDRANPKKCFKGKEGTTEIKPDVFTTSDPLLENNKRIQLRGETGKPFNWTYKINTNSKGLVAGRYNIDPNNLKAKIIDDGDKIFDKDENADFIFYLTAADIRNIKDYNNQNNGLEFDIDNSSFNSLNGVLVYRSSFLRDSKISRILKQGSLDDARGYNNIKLYKGVQ